jgi:uncharacterized membrane protein YgdD (TMEM256/DUF423 family)
MNVILLIGGFLGFSSVAMAAIAEHGMQDLDHKIHHMLETAIHYHQLYAIVITVLGLVLLRAPERLAKKLQIAAYATTAGLVFFSGSIYAFVLTDASFWIKLTPVGGVTLMLGWVLIIWAALTESQRG